MISRYNLLRLGLSAFALLLGGCAGPSLTEQNFGESVRQMIRAQTYDQSTLESPSTETIESTDGQMLGNALEAYRSTVSAPASANQEVVIDLGGQ
jgi:hypothetical protein